MYVCVRAYVRLTRGVVSCYRLSLLFSPTFSTSKLTKDAVARGQILERDALSPCWVSFIRFQDESYIIYNVYSHTLRPINMEPDE